MRLKKLERGHAFKQKMILFFLTVYYRTTPPDVVRTLLYRPELFGSRFNRYIQRALRGVSKWQVWEREAMAAFISSRNQCPF